MLWITPQLQRYGGLCALIPLGNEDLHTEGQSGYNSTTFLGKAWWCKNCCRSIGIAMLLLTEFYFREERDNCAGGRHSVRYHARGTAVWGKPQAQAPPRPTSRQPRSGPQEELG